MMRSPITLKSRFHFSFSHSPTVSFIPARMMRSPITLKSRFPFSGANLPPVS
jgi:hypothetical protein